MGRTVTLLACCAAVVWSGPASWYKGKSAHVKCQSSSGTHDVRLLPVLSTVINNTYKAVGLYEPCLGTDLSPALCDRAVKPIVSTFDDAVMSWRCHQLVPTFGTPFDQLHAAAVFTIEGSGSCGALLCVVGGGAASVQCSSDGGTHWESGPTLHFAVRHPAAVVAVDIDSGNESIYLLGGERPGAPELLRHAIVQSVFNPSTCSLGPWESVVTSPPYGGRSHLLAAAAPIQGGLYVGLGADHDDDSPASSGWFSDLYFAPFNNMSDPSAWTLVTRALPSPGLPSFSSSPPMLAVEVALNYYTNVPEAVDMHDMDRLRALRSQWLGLGPGDDDDRPGHVPGLLMLLGDSLLFSLGMAANGDRAIAGDRHIELRSTVFPRPDPWGMGRTPIIRAPAVMVDPNPAHGGHIVIQGVDPYQYSQGTMATILGYPTTACSDACPGGTFTDGCVAHPWDAKCSPCRVCSSGIEYEHLACRAMTINGYGDTICKPCGGCDDGYELETPCNRTHPSVCRLTRELIPPEPVIENDMPGPVISACLATNSVLTIAIVLVAGLVWAKKRRGGQGRDKGEVATWSGASWSRFTCLALGLLEMAKSSALIVMAATLSMVPAALVYAYPILMLLVVQVAGAVVVVRQIAKIEPTVGPAVLLAGGLHPRALLALSVNRQRPGPMDGTKLRLQLASAKAAAWGSMACSLLGDLIPALLLLRFTYTVTEAPRAHVPALWLSCMCILLALATLMVASSRLGRLRLLTSLTGTTTVVKGLPVYGHELGHGQGSDGSPRSAQRPGSQRHMHELFAQGIRPAMAPTAVHENVVHSSRVAQGERIARVANLLRSSPAVHDTTALSYPASDSYGSPSRDSDVVIALAPSLASASPVLASLGHGPQFEAGHGMVAGPVLAHPASPATTDASMLSSPRMAPAPPVHVPILRPPPGARTERFAPAPMPVPGPSREGDAAHAMALARALALQLGYPVMPGMDGGSSSSGSSSGSDGSSSGSGSESGRDHHGPPAIGGMSSRMMVQLLASAGQRLLSAASVLQDDGGQVSELGDEDEDEEDEPGTARQNANDDEDDADEPSGHGGSSSARSNDEPRDQAGMERA